MAVMAPLDYDKLFGFVERAESQSIDSLEDEEVTECLQVLKQVESERENADTLCKLFKASVIVAEFKAAQAEAYSQGAEEEAEKSANREADLEGRVEGLQDELSKLRMQMAAGDTGKDGQTLRAEVERLQDELIRIEKDKRETEIELAEEKNKTDRLERLSHDSEKLTRDYQTQIRGLDYQVEEMRKRLVTSTEGQNARAADKEEVQRKLKARTEQMMELMDQMETMTSNNESLTTELNDIKERLEEATVQMNKTADINLQLKDALLTSDMVIESLQKEKEELRSRDKDGVGSADQSGGAELMSAVEKKIEDWKDILHTKESENTLLKEKMEKLQQQLNEYNVDSDKASVAALSKALEDRNEQIQGLKAQLSQGTKDMNEICEMVEAQRVLYTGSDDKGGARMAQMVQRMKEMDEKTKEARKRVEQTEGQTIKRDKEIATLLARMTQYEKGEYGLSEAVKEVENLKTQIEFRNKQIGQLTTKCTDLYQQVQDLSEENADYRERLGLKKRVVKIEGKDPLHVLHDPKKDSERAMNIILQQEVDRLEDERVDLKLQMRSMAQKIGQKAATLGLSVDDTLLLDNIAEGLKNSRNSTLAQISHLREERNQPYLNLASDQQKLLKSLDYDSSDMRKKISHLEAENLDLIEALKHFKMNLKHGEGFGTIQCPPLERLLKRLEINKVGEGRLVQEMQSKVDEAVGGNEQLKSLLQQMAMSLQTSNKQVEDLKSQNDELKERLEEHVVVDEDYKAITISNAAPLTSSELIKSLNDQLLKTLHELNKRKKHEENVEQVLQAYQSKFSVLKHSYGVLHEQFFSKTNQLESEKKELIEKYNKLEETNTSSVVKLQEYDRLLDTMSRGGSEIERRIAEMSRKFTVALINQKIMTRKYTYIVNDNEFLRRAQEDLNNQILQRDKVVSEHMAYLQRQKEMASFEIKSLQKALGGTVAIQDYDKLEKQLEDVTEKYRKVLEKETTSVQAEVKFKELEVEAKKLKIENHALHKIIDTEKQKSSTLEMLPSTGTNDQMESKLNILEMKELNERQRADFAQARYESIQEDIKVVETRNIELDKKLEQLGETCLQLQSNEQDLQMLLSESVTKTTNEENMSKIKNLEKIEAELRAELESLKTVADVAQLQFEHIRKNDKAREEEVEELRSAVRDLQATTDNRSIIGKLHQDIMHFKLESTDNEEDVAHSHKRIQELQTRILRCEQRYDHKERSLRYVRFEHSQRINYMRKNLQELRHRFAGCVPLKDLEKFNDMVLKLRDDQEIILKELQRAKEKTEEVEANVEEMESQKAQLQIALGNKHASNIVEAVSNKNKTMQLLHEKKYVRRLQKAFDQAAFYKMESEKQERIADSLDQELSSMIKEFEEKEAMTEIRQAELEKRLEHFEIILSTEERSLMEIEIGPDGIPDPSLPVHIQLDHAIRCLKKNIRKGIDYKREIEQLKRIYQDLASLESQKKRLEVDSVGRQNLSEHLQSMLSVSMNADVINVPQRNHLQDMQRMTNASQAVTQALQAQLAQKEESLNVYKQLVDASRNELLQSQRRHEQELIKIKSEEANVMQDHLNQLRQQVQRLGTDDVDDDITAQFLRIAELEDTVTEQETAINSLVNKMKVLRAENDSLRKNVQQNSPYSASLKPASKKKSVASSISTIQEIDGPPSAEINIIQAEVNDEEDEHVSVSQHQHPPPIPEENLTDSSDSSKHTEAAPKSSSHGLRSLKSTKESSISHISNLPLPGPANAKAIEWKVKFERLKRRMEQIQKENKGLKITVAQLTKEIESEIGDTGVRRLSDAPPKNGLADIELKDLKNQISDLTATVERRTKEVEKLTRKEGEASEDVQELREDLKQKNFIISKLKKEKAELEKEMEGLERRLKSIRESMKMKLTETENRQLKKKVEVLQSQMTQARRTQPERDTGPDLSKSQTLAKWDERKRYQQQLDRAKLDLDQKIIKIRDSDELIERLRERITRLEQQNAYFQSKFDAKGVTVKQEPIKAKVDQVTKSDGALVAENNKLKAKCKQLESKYEAFVEVINEMLMNNENKEDREYVESTELPKTSPDLEKMLKDLQKLILNFKTDHKNMMEREEFYKTKLSLLEEEVHALGEEDSRFEYIDRTSGIGTINRLHDMIEQLETEKEALKQSVDRLTMDTSRVHDSDVQRLIRENKDLKDKVNRAAPRVAWARDLSTTNPSNTSEIHKLNVALEKERKENGGLKHELGELHLAFDKLQTDFDRLQILSSNRRKYVTNKDSTIIPQLPSRSKQSTNPKQLEHLLHTEIERSQTLLYENRRLREKIQALEWRSEHDISTDQYLRTIRNLKAEINHLQAESAEQQLELEVINRNIKPAIAAHSNTLDIMLFKERLKNYDAILKENIDLKLKLNSLNPSCLRNMKNISIPVL